MADINSRLPTQDQADGATGAATPSEAILVGGSDGTDLRAISTNASGQVNVNNISGTVSLPTGAATATNQTAVIGSAAAGTAATSSELTGGIFNTSLPTLTTGQQAAIQLDSSGRQIISPLSSSSVVTANQGTANTVANAWPIEVTNGTSVAAVKAASTAAVAIDPSLVIALSPNSPIPTGSNTIGSVNQGTSPWVTKDQSDGTPGSAPPSVAIQVAGTDGTDLRVLSTTSTGQLNVIDNNPAVNFTATIAGTGNLFSQTGMLQYNSFIFALTGTWVATVQAQASNDGTTYFVIPVGSMTNLNQGPINSITVNDYYYIPINYQWLKIVVTAYTSGTVSFNAYESGSNNEPIIPDKAQLQDNSGNGITSYNSQLSVDDIINTSITSGSITVSTTAVALRVGASNLTNRKMVMFCPTTGVVYLGSSSSVTTSTGIPIFPNNVISFAFSANVTPYLIAAASTTVQVFEGA